jgi:hypothetical protein
LAPGRPLAALRAADLGANTLLVAPAEFGGMAANTWQEYQTDSGNNQ